jgi:hypothetical protein
MHNNTFYASNDYRNYLAHYGVKGMKWGVRKNRQTAERRKKKSVKKVINDLAVKGSVAYAKRYHRNLIEKSQEERQSAARMKDLARAKNLRDVAGVYVGNKRNARVHRVNADMYDEMSKYTTLNSTKRRLKAQAENSRTFSDYYDRRSKKRGIDKVVETVIGKEYYSLPYKKANGKTVTYGRYLAEEMLKNLAKSAIKTAAQNEIKKRREQKQRQEQEQRSE